MPTSQMGKEKLQLEAISGRQKTSEGFGKGYRNFPVGYPAFFPYDSKDDGQEEVVSHYLGMYILNSLKKFPKLQADKIINNTYYEFQ